VAEVSTYYGQPVIKEPVWTWEIPNYLYTGGVAGASAGLAFACELRGDERLARRAWAVSLVAVTVSPALLVADLGVPTRFFNMLRMFKVTSPMSVGSWILSGSGLTTGLAAVNAWTGLFPRLARVARPSAAVLGLPLSTYTAALISNTAVPVWHQARLELPFVFGAGAALGAGAATLAVSDPDIAGPARRLALGGAVAELAVERLMEKRLGELAGPYEMGTPHRLAQLSRGLTAAGGALLAWRGRSSAAWARVAGGLMSAGALATRWSIFKAGLASAADPRQTIAPQREAIERGERPGAARRTARVDAVEPAKGSPAINVVGAEP